MKALLAAMLCAGLAFAEVSAAQSPAAEKKQQARAKSCSQQAGNRQGRERQAFVTACLKGAKPKAVRKKR